MSIAEYVGMAQTAGARGQQNRPAAAAPSRPAATTPLPRARDGKPDLSGIWQVMNTANFDIQDHSARDGVPAGQDLSAKFKPKEQSIWELTLGKPITGLTRGTLVVSVKDRQGNVSRIERSFSTGKGKREPSR